MQNVFNKNIIPANEVNRLQALHSYGIVNSESEVFFNNLAHIMARCFQMPIALISLVDKEHVFFKANVGMQHTRTVPRSISLCSLAILDSQPTIFEDTLQDPCLLSNPLVAGEFGMRFYAGAPIITTEGFHIGTVCVVDKKPRTFSDTDQDLLVLFSSSVMEAIRDRKESLHQALS